MFGFLDRFRERQQEQAGDARKEFLKLVSAAVKKPDLTDAEGERVIEVCKTLGVPVDDAPDSFAEIVADLRRHRELMPQVTRLADMRAAVANAGKSLQTFDAETDKVVRDLQAKRQSERQVMDSAATATKAELKAAERAATELQAIERRRFSELGIADPQIAEQAEARRAHFAHMDCAKYHGRNNVYSFERLATAHRMENKRDQDLSQWDFVPLPGQSMDEVNEYLSLWRDAKKARFVRLLSPREKTGDLVPQRLANTCADAFCEFGELLAGANQGRDPFGGNVQYLPWPGVSLSEHRRMIERLNAAYEKYLKEKHAREAGARHVTALQPKW